MHDVAWRCDMNSVRSKDAHKQLARTSLKQQFAFKQEKDNKHDRFAVAGQTILPGTPSPFTVGHIPIELSRYIWYALQRGADIRGEVKSVEYKPSPLVQRGLEIPIEVALKWEERRVMDMLQAKIGGVSYPLGDSDGYIDQYKDILKSILPNDDVSTDSGKEEDDV